MAVSGSWGGENGRNVEKRADQSDGKDEWTLHRMLPLSGYELNYNSSLWSDPVEGYSNCYAYAIDNQLTKMGLLWYKQQPGEYVGIYLDSSDCDEDGEAIIDAAEADFREYGIENNQEMVFMSVDRYEVCPQGTYKIALVTAPNIDYHWYRQDSDGLWSHKQGTAPVSRTDESGNLIFDPKIADRGEYTEFIGYFAVTPWGNYCASVAELSLNTFALNNADVSNIVVDIDTITIGMTYDQVVSILGCSGVDIGYGAILYQYELYNGQKVVLNYCKDTYGEMILCNIIYV
jgi:hypothetical protein